MSYVLLQVLLLLVTAYVLGSERKYHTADEWLSLARGNIAVAVTAKLLPYTILFLVVSVVANQFYFDYMHIPCSSHGWLLAGLTVLFLVSTQAVAVTLYALFPVLGLVISAVSMIGSLGATLCGVTFPVYAMYKPVYIASFFFPIRHFVIALQQLLYAGNGSSSPIGQLSVWGDVGFFSDGIWQSVVWLFAFLLLPCLCLTRLKDCIQKRRYEAWE